MCPAAVHFWMNVRYRILDQRTTAGANEVFIAPPNSERIGFQFASAGGTINVRPASLSINANFFTFSLGGTVPYRPLTILEFGTMILESWQFTLVNAGNNYAIIELYTPADFKNEVMGK